MATMSQNRTKVMKRSSNSYSPEEWKSHRALITRLYSLEGKTLKEVRDHLEQVYNFAPTERMYKSRLHTWGLDKKKKEHEMLDLVRRGHSHAGDKDSFSSEIRGRQVTYADALHYFNRKNIKDPISHYGIESLDASYDASASVDNQALVDSPPDISGAITPISSREDPYPNGCSISNPELEMAQDPHFKLDNPDIQRIEHLKRADFATPRLQQLCKQRNIEVLHNLAPFSTLRLEGIIPKVESLTPINRKYCEAIFPQVHAHYRVVCDKYGLNKVNMDRWTAPWTAMSADSEADQFQKDIIHGYADLYSGSDGWREKFESGYGRIDGLVKSSDPAFLIYVLDITIRYARPETDTAPYQRLLAHIAFATASQTGDASKEPLRLIADWLQNAPPEVSRPQVALQCLGNLHRAFEDKLGAFDPLTRSVLHMQATGLLNNEDFAGSAALFRRAAEQIQTAVGLAGAYENAYTYRNTAEAYFLLGDYNQSLQAIKMSLDASQTLARNKEREIHVRCLKQLAEISEVLGYHGDATESVSLVYQICAATWGPTHAYTRRARMHQKSIYKRDKVLQTAHASRLYRIGRGGDAAEMVWSKPGSPPKATMLTHLAMR